MIINFYRSYNKYSLLQRYIRTVNTTLTMHDHACWCAACFTTVRPRISTSLITWNVWWLGHVKKPKPVENVPKATPMMNACNWTRSDCPKKTFMVQQCFLGCLAPEALETCSWNSCFLLKLSWNMLSTLETLESLDMTEQFSIMCAHADINLLLGRTWPTVFVLNNAPFGVVSQWSVRTHDVAKFLIIWSKFQNNAFAQCKCHCREVVFHSAEIVFS